MRGNAVKDRTIRSLWAAFAGFMLAIALTQILKTQDATQATYAGIPLIMYFFAKSILED
jgi:hypothetical protein